MIFKDLSIKYKIILVATVLAAIFLGSTLGYVIINTRQFLTRLLLSSVTYEATLQSNSIDAKIDEIIDDVIFLNTVPPVQGIIRAIDEGGFDSLDNSSLEQWKERMQVIFAATEKTQGIYSQLRYIDQNGDELIRVNFVDGSPVAVPDNELQNKSSHFYFTDIMQQEKGSIYVGKASLNLEGNPPKISYPLDPVIRIGSPVFNDITGERRGFIIANVSVDDLLDQVTRANSDNSSLYIIDRSNHFVFNKDEDKEWGGENDLNTGISFETEFPELSQYDFSNDSGSYVLGSGIITYSKVYFGENNEHTWTLFVISDASTIFGPIRYIVYISGLIGVATFIALFFAFVFMIQRFLRPLEDLEKGVKKISQGDLSAKVPIYGKDEIGKVSSSFNAMASQLKNSYSLMESKIEEKTKNLNSKLQESEDLKKAMMNLLEDIDDEKRELAIEKTKDEAILASIGDGLIVTNAHRRINIVNDASIKMLGLSREEMIGQLWPEVLGEGCCTDADSKVMSVENMPIFQATKNGKTIYSNKISLINSDKKHFPVAITASPIFDLNNTIIGSVVVFRDITQEREVDKAKSEFVSLASHQLRTPLSTISWYSEMLLAGDVGKLSKDQVEYINEIYAGNKRMIDLVNALLNVSRIDLGTFMVEPEDVSLTELADSVIKEQMPQANEKKHSIKTNFAKKLPIFNGDPKLLRIIFQNLLSNAIKYTPEKGKIEVGIEKKKSKILIYIKDNGLGIPKAQQKKIFQKLFRADNVKVTDTQGTGLGLYLVKSIVEHSGGKIWFTSKLNSGTVFNVELPASGMKAKKGSRRIG